MRRIEDALNRIRYRQELILSWQCRANGSRSAASGDVDDVIGYFPLASAL